MDSIEPASDCEHIDHIVEAESGFLEAGCEPAHVLHPAEETFDDISHGVEVRVVCNRFTGIRLCRNDGKRTIVGNLTPDPIGRVGLVGDDGERLCLPAREGVEHLAVMELTTGNLQP